MDQIDHDNWKTIAESMEANGDTQSWFYFRARAIADGKPDPMPTKDHASMALFEHGRELF